MLQIFLLSTMMMRCRAIAFIALMALLVVHDTVSFIPTNHPQKAFDQRQSSTLHALATTKHDWAKTAAAIMMAGLILLGTVPQAVASESRVIGELKGSGLIFKDTLTIESFEDPKVKGVTLYISNFQRPLTERLSKDFFSDPSDASVGCAKTGKIQIADNIAMGKAGEQVFEESRSLLFKTLRVQRVYDKETNTIVYVSFNTRLDKSDDTNKSRFKSSLCTVNLD